MMLSWFDSSEGTARFEGGSIAKSEVELQLDLTRIKGFTQPRCHFQPPMDTE